MGFDDDFFSSVLIFVIINRKEKVIVKSQAVFIYIFIVGAFFMNFSILTLVGPNSDRNCLLRVWAFDISSTIMFAPLLMKLHRIDMLFRMSKKLKKLKINDAMVRLCAQKKKLILFCNQLFSAINCFYDINFSYFIAVLCNFMFVYS